MIIPETVQVSVSLASSGVFAAFGTALLASAPSVSDQIPSGLPKVAIADHAMSGSEAREMDVVVVGQRAVIVNGQVIRCNPRHDDPIDKVDLRSMKGWSNWSPVPRYMAIIPDGENGFVWTANREQITGPDFWQRVGAGMSNYVFRAFPDERPMCVGGHAGPYTFAGFRRIIDAARFRGQRLRFTAWVATRRADQVSFWLGAESIFKDKNGGNTNNVPFHGDHLWTPVLLETGPIKKSATRVSYGFNLQGSGDVWVYHPRLEVLNSGEWNGDSHDKIIFGS